MIGRSKKKSLSPLQKLKMSQIGVRENPKKPKKKKSARQTLEDLADTWYPRYIRLTEATYNPRTQSFEGLCFTCDRKLQVVAWDGSQWRWNRWAQDGHFVRRRHKSVRWDDTNNHLQCSWCNGIREPHEMEEEYARRLDAEYGMGYAAELRARGVPNHKPSIEELQDIADSSRKFVEFTLAHPEGLR